MKARQLFELALLGESASVESGPFWAGMRIFVRDILVEGGGGASPGRRTRRGVRTM